MKKKIIPLISALAIGATVMIAPACADSGGDKTPITYQEYSSSTVGFQDNRDNALSNYNSDLYYINEWKTGYNTPNTSGNYFPDMGDPMIVWDDGYYYAFGTRGADCFHCFRSPDLTNWTRLANAFEPDDNSWGRTNLWAPDIQKINGRWYLYYTAGMIGEPMYDSDKREHCQIGVAVSDNVYGPYKQFTGTNGNGETVTLKDTPFKGLEGHTVLDQTVFRDDDGKLYMYFSYDTNTGSPEHRAQSKNGATAEIWAVEMKDAVTWDLSTLKPLMSAGYKNFDDTKRTIGWETWSPSFRGEIECLEGPYMVKHGGKYLLTYCANSFVDAEYSVGYAVSDSPMGPFVKPDDYYLQNMLLGVPGAPGTYISNRYKGFTRGTGHAAIFKTGGGEYMFAYHAHFNREVWSDEIPFANWRALAVDYLHFDSNGNPYTNGPTYSLQNTPSDVSGLKNLAPQATIRAEGDNAQYLNDNYTNRINRTVLLDKTKRYEAIREAEFKAGTRSIELKFPSPVTVKAVNIYNSCDLEYSVKYIDQIDFGNGNGIVNALFNTRYIHDDFIFPHRAFNIELGSEVVTDRIVITISSDTDFALGEIEVMCKQ